MRSRRACRTAVAITFFLALAICRTALAGTAAGEPAAEPAPTAAAQSPAAAEPAASTASAPATGPAAAAGPAPAGATPPSAALDGAATTPEATLSTPPAPFPPDAESLAREYRRSGQATAIEHDRAALVPYGHGHPVLRCAPLRACAVELEPGELVLSTASGDSERWLVQVVATGPAARTPLVVVKPTACDLSTNLLVSTDRRLYEVGLEAPPCRDADAGRAGAYNPRLPYTGITRFYYPDDLVRRWAGEEDAARRASTERASGAVALSTPLAALNFAYTWERDHRFPWTPAQVFDDGRHTYVVLPPGARSAEAPALFLVQPGNRLALLNYRVENGTYVADRVLDHAVLTVAAGHGKAPYRLEIVNHAARGAR
jgi:P-type conjugative transfer protein TrbG